MGEVAVRSSVSFGDRLIRLMERVDTRRADSVADREAVYRQRYDAYVREGMINPTPGGKLTDAFDDLPNAYVFGIHIDGQLVSSIRIVVVSPQFPNSPAVSWFEDELKPEVAAGKVIIDPNRFAADAEATRAFPELPYITVRLGFVAALHFDADIVTATVRDEHQAFYQRVFGLQKDISPRLRPTIEKPIGLMSIREFSTRERIMRRYPCFASTPEERQRLFDRGPKDAASQVRGRNGAPAPARQDTGALHLV